MDNPLLIVQLIYIDLICRVEVPDQGGFTNEQLLHVAADIQYVLNQPSLIIRLNQWGAIAMLSTTDVAVYPSKFFSALQLYCFRLSVGMLSYNSRLTLIRLDRRKKIGRVSRGFGPTTINMDLYY